MKTAQESVKTTEELRRLCDEADATDAADSVDPEEMFARFEARYGVKTNSGS